MAMPYCRGRFNSFERLWLLLYWRAHQC